MRNPQGNDVSRSRAWIVLVLMIGLALIAMILGWAMSEARAAQPCVKPAATLALFKAHDATLTALKDDALAKSKVILLAMAKQNGKSIEEPTSGWLVEFSDASGGLIFAGRKCTSVILKMTPQVPIGALKRMLFSEKLALPAPIEPPKLQDGAILPDLYDRLDI